MPPKSGAAVVLEAALELLEALAGFDAASDGVANASPRMVAADATTNAERLIWFLSMSVGEYNARFRETRGLHV